MCDVEHDRIPLLFGVGTSGDKTFVPVMARHLL